MQILLANAKIMKETASVQPWTQPKFQAVSNKLAMEMAELDITALSHELDCSRSLAKEAWRRYQDFFAARPLPAIMAYNGQSYKHLKAETLDENALTFGQQHLWINCFLYGLLRPMDAIVPYRMEHCAKLPMTAYKPINTFWKDRLTDTLIESVKADDGVLLHLSTEEYEHLFHWQRVCREVEVIHPLFYVRQGDGSLRMQAVWAKACRGAMVRYVLTHAISDPEALQAFTHEGFAYNPRLGERNFPHFVRETTA